MSRRFIDKVAIVTGGARGLGAVTAQLLAEEGAVAVIADTDVDEADATAQAIRAQGGKAVSHACDVSREDDWIGMIQTVLSEYGRLDVLVNNAGIGGRAIGDHDALDGWERLFAVHATGPYLGTKHAANVMKETGTGSIVNVSSIMAIVASLESHPGYAASKAALRHYTKSAACRYGPSGIRVNAVCPGFMPPMKGGSLDSTLKYKVPVTPLRRIGEHSEVARGILFLASDEASFITGIELVIDGGYVLL